jgi:hypothetical protein
MLASLFNLIIAIAALVAILDWFGIKPKQFPEWKIMPLSRRWKLAIMLLLVAASLAMSAYSLYRSNYCDNNFAWTGTEPSKRIVGKYFENQKIYLDDDGYSDCTFRNVTFVYNGTHKLDFSHNTVLGTYTIGTDNPSINGSLVLLRGLNLLNIPLIGPDGKPLEGVQQNFKPQ